MLAMPSMTWSWKIDWDHTRVKKGEIHRCVFRKAEEGWAMLVRRLRHKLGNNLAPQHVCYVQPREEEVLVSVGHLWR